MSRSQRHRVVFENYASNGAGIAQGAVAPGYLRQQPGPYVVPMGTAGGPLQGSSLSGPAPTALPSPKGELLKVLALGAIVSGGGPLEPPADPVATSTRAFPIGPIALDQISFNTTDNDLEFDMSDDPTGPFAEVQVGDTVRIEATGNSSINGDKVVTAISDPPGFFWVDGADPGNGPIMAKGRVTIISGA